jgi:hypothetical protein
LFVNHQQKDFVQGMMSQTRSCRADIGFALDFFNMPRDEADVPEMGWGLKKGDSRVSGYTTQRPIHRLSTYRPAPGFAGPALLPLEAVGHMGRRDRFNTGRVESLHRRNSSIVPFSLGGENGLSYWSSKTSGCFRNTRPWSRSDFAGPGDYSLVAIKQFLDSKNW